MSSKLPDPAEPHEIEIMRLSSGTRLRVWAFSDLHADSSANLEKCVEGWPMAQPYENAIKKARGKGILGRLRGESFEAAFGGDGDDGDDGDDENAMFTKARAALQRTRYEAAVVVEAARAAAAEGAGAEAAEAETVDAVLAAAEAEPAAAAEAVLVGPGFTEVLDSNEAETGDLAKDTGDEGGGGGGGGGDGGDDGARSGVVDVLILAGDAAGKVETLRTVFTAFRGRYDHVFFIHGNHEAWAGKSDDSLAKLDLVEQVCEECGVRTHPVLFQFNEPDDLEGGVGDVGADDGEGRQRCDVCVFPLYSWYHASFNTEPNLRDHDGAYAEQSASFLRRWQDFRQCRWPTSLVPDHAADFASLSTTSQSIADHFAAMNEPALAAFEAVLEADREEANGRYANGREDLEVVSFSHFLPVQGLLPEKRFLLEPDLVSVVGSDPLREQVERLQPDTHVYGHTHIPFDLVLGGTRFLQWPLGNGETKLLATTCPTTPGTSPPGI